MTDRLHLLQRHPRRISITVTPGVHEALLTRSEDEGRSVSNLCAFLLEEAQRDQPPLALPAAPTMARTAVPKRRRRTSDG